MPELTLGPPHAADEAVQLAAQEVALLLQLLDAFLEPGVLLQGDVQVSPQVRDQDEGAVGGVMGVMRHGICREEKNTCMDIYIYTQTYILLELLNFVRLYLASI